MSSEPSGISDLAVPQQGEGGGPLALIGRRREQLLLDAQLEGARSGSGTALLLRGEPGIGKSALCRYASLQADGFQVLRSRAHESEAEIAFQALADLFQPILHHVGDLPGSQQGVLASVLGIGPPVPADLATLAAASVGLLAIAAEERPVLAVVDDAQWLDPPSADALVFASRRLGAERIAFLFSAREQDLGFETTGLRGLRVAGLEPHDARALLLASLGEPPPEAVIESLVEASAGNPLALIEVPRALSAAQLRGAEPLPDPLPAGAGLSSAFERRLAGLPGPTREALPLAACAGGAHMAAIAAALDALDLTLEALEPAEDAGLIALGGAGLEFSHPLVRSVAYHGASAPDRRRAHRALAIALEDEPERRAWHLAAAAVEPSEEVAAELEWAGALASKRSGHACAARALERAAQLTPSAGERARRLLAAASEAQRAGQLDWSASCLEEVLAVSAEPGLRVEARHLWGAVESLRGSSAHACELFLQAASEAEPADRGWAASLVADAAGASAVGGDLRAAELLLGRAAELAGEAGEGSPPIAGIEDFVSLLRGRTPAPQRLLARVEELREGDELSPAALPVVAWTVWCLGWTAEADRARTLYVEMIARARAESRLGALPTLLLGLGELELRAGMWPEAYAHLSEAAELAAYSSQASVRAASCALLARVEAARGVEGECRDHLREAEALAEGLGAGIVAVHAKATRGHLELGLGNLDAAVAELEAARRSAEEAGLEHPGVVPYEPDLIEACWRSGQLDRASEVLAVLQLKAKRTGSSWAHAVASRCRGMLAPAEEFEEHLTEALREHTRTTARFDRARAELCLGERLRRERQRSDARSHLRAALDAFERLGAEPWADRARGELGATAQTARGRDADLDLLTPQELQVAMVVAEGTTNREAAAALFVSPRTIDAHLQHIYRKLGLRSRHQLARAVARRQGAGESPPGPFRRVAAAPAQALTVVAALVLGAGIVTQAGVPGGLFGGGDSDVFREADLGVVEEGRNRAKRDGTERERATAKPRSGRGARFAVGGAAADRPTVTRVAAPAGVGASAGGSPAPGGGSNGGDFGGAGGGGGPSGTGQPVGPQPQPQPQPSPAPEPPTGGGGGGGDVPSPPPSAPPAEPQQPPSEPAPTSSPQQPGNGNGPPMGFPAGGGPPPSTPGNGPKPKG